MPVPQSHEHSEKRKRIQILPLWSVMMKMTILLLLKTSKSDPNLLCKVFFANVHFVTAPNTRPPAMPQSSLPPTKPPHLNSVYQRKALANMPVLAQRNSRHLAQVIVLSIHKPTMSHFRVGYLDTHINSKVTSLYLTYYVKNEGRINFMKANKRTWSVHSNSLKSTLAKQYH